MLSHRQSDPYERTKVKFASKHHDFRSWNTYEKIVCKMSAILSDFNFTYLRPRMLTWQPPGSSTDAGPAPQSPGSHPLLEVESQYRKWTHPENLGNRLYSASLIACVCCTKAGLLDQSHKSHNATVPCPTMLHFVTEMCTHVHISVTKWCIVGYLSNALWSCEMSLFISVDKGGSKTLLSS